MTKPLKTPDDPKRGRPFADQPLEIRELVRLTRQDKQEFQAEIERLTLVTGQKWTMSAYLRMAGRAMKGRHLA